MTPKQPSFNPFPNDKFQNLPTEFAGDNLKFNENGRKFSKRVENTVGKEKLLVTLLVTSNFSSSHSVFKRLIFQTRKKWACLGKG